MSLSFPSNSTFIGPPVAGAGALARNAAWSLVGLFKSDVAATYRQIYDEYANYNKVINLQINNDGTVGAVWRNAGAGVFITSAAGTRLDDGAWHTFLFVRRAANDYELYVDETSRGTSTVNETGTFTPTEWNIGRLTASDGGNQPFTGSLSRVTGFPVAITAAQATTFLNTGVAPSVPSFQYEMGKASPEPDYSGYGRRAAYSFPEPTVTADPPAPWTALNRRFIAEGALTSYGLILADGTGWEDLVGVRCILRFSDTDYRMWYEGLATGPVSAIGYATSTDGYTWTRYGSNPILELGQAWETARGICPKTVLYEGGAFKMWYHNDTGGLGYATSPDGLVWTKYAGNPVIAINSAAWHNQIIAEPNVVHVGTTYHMIFAGITGGGPCKFGYASSPDGIAWTESGSNPIFESLAGAEIGNGVFWPWLSYDNGLYHLWYSADQITYPGTGICDDLMYAWSTDCITWKRGAKNPVLNTGPGNGSLGATVYSPIKYFVTYHNDDGIYGTLGDREHIVRQVREYARLRSV